MPYARVMQYKTFYDTPTGVHFNETLDVRTGVSVGIAEVNEERAQHYAVRAGFVGLSDEDLVTKAGRAAIAESNRRRALARRTAPEGDETVSREMIPAGGGV